MNIYDISRKAGVSIATVSRVLNGSKSVASKTRANVQETIDKYGYTPNAFARGLGLNSMHTIGILCADSSDPYLARAVYFIEQDLRKNDYDSLLCCTGHSVATKKNCINLLISKHVDGIILVGSHYVDNDDKNNDYIRLCAEKIPVILLNGVIDGDNIYCTVCDDYNAMLNTALSFFGENRHKLMYLYNSNSYSGRHKLAGFKDAYKQQGIPLEDKYIVFIDDNSMDINGRCDWLIENYPDMPIDGIVAADDALAVGALKYVKYRHLTIPQDVSIIGYNNFELGQCSEPELSSIDNKLEPLSHHCVTTLMGVIQGKELPKVTNFTVTSVKRGTTNW